VDLRNGRSIDGTLLGSDKDHLYVERDSGGHVAIDRNDIDYIDYPGNVLQIGGGLTLLAGVVTANDSPSSSRSEAALTTAVCYLPGLAMLVWGTYLNVQARGLARNVTQEQERIHRERPYLPAPRNPLAPSYEPVPTYQPASSELARGIDQVPRPP
jgi:hypothetical protein